jgi:hypothetical protein
MNQEWDLGDEMSMLIPKNSIHNSMEEANVANHQRKQSESKYSCPAWQNKSPDQL